MSHVTYVTVIFFQVTVLLTEHADHMPLYATYLYDCTTPSDAVIPARPPSVLCDCIYLRPEVTKKSVACVTRTSMASVTGGIRIHVHTVS